MATLPRQVQAQLDAASAVLNPQSPPVETPPAPSVEPPQPPAPAPTIEQPPAPPAPAPVPPQSGLSAKEINDLKASNGRLRQTIDTLTAQVQNLMQQVSQPPAPTPAPTAAPKPVADPTDVETFGLDMVTMVQRVTEQMFGPVRQVVDARFQHIEAQLKSLSEAIQGTSQSIAYSVEETFFDKLTSLCPQWQQLNANEAFLSYLAEVDPIYGLPRDAALKDAQSKADAPRAAAIFKAFLGTLPPQVTAPPIESPSPRSTAGSPPPPPPTMTIVPQAEITQFYDEVSKGKWRHNLAEMQRREAAYNAALAEGRVR